jgi:hypothetical protein
VDADGNAFAASALASLGLTRGGLHERAMTNLRRAVPPSFAPSDEPAVLEDEQAATLLVLPELVPAGEAWIAFALRGEGLIVMREGAPSTREELRRLDRARHDDPKPIFTRPLRITKRGFEPLDWPSKGGEP